MTVLTAAQQARRDLEVADDLTPAQVQAVIEAFESGFDPADLDIYTDAELAL